VQTSLDAETLTRYVAAQLAAVTPDPALPGLPELRTVVDGALERVERCFAEVVRAGYGGPDGVVFDHLHSDQYCTFLWLASNESWKRGHERTAARLFVLNKALHAFNCMYDAALPEVFVLVHPVGTALGKAIYGERLVVANGCTVGQIGGRYPTIGSDVLLSAGASVIGPCTIGDGAMIGPACAIVKTDVAPGTLVTTDARLVFGSGAPSLRGPIFR
jgi:serine O-acetyltransferase